MTLVATLMSARAAAAVDEPLIRRLMTALGTAPGSAIDVLEPGIAAAFAIPDAWPDLRAAADAVRALIGDAPVDVAVRRGPARRARLLLADMDSTMIGQECIDELAAEIGLKAHVSAITERAMRGEIAFEPALRERVALLKGLSHTIADKVIANRITLTPGGSTLIATMRAHGAYTALVSGGFTLFTRPIAAMLGFDETRANELVIANEMLDGTVAEPILGQDAKRDHLLRLAQERQIDIADTIAVGDGANDLAMIRQSGLGVAYHAKPKVAAESDIRIDHADLTALLFIQGYAATEFVSGE